MIGTRKFGDGPPMTRDSIFRIASLTKPIAAVATMMLVDDGVLHLDDTVDEWLPELANPQVLRSIDAELDDTVPAVRAITVDDLLTYRFGWGNILVPPDTYPIQRAEVELDLKTLGPPWPPTRHTPDEWMQRLGSLPLMYQPGEQWLYNTAGAGVGRAHRAGGRLAPGSIPARANLRAARYGRHGIQRVAATTRSPDDGVRARSGNRRAGGARRRGRQLVERATGAPERRRLAGVDHRRLLELRADAADRRSAPGCPIISAASIELMTTDQLTRRQREADRLFLGDTGGWGLGLLVPAAGDDGRRIAGGYGWDGGTGTTWRSDMRRDVTGILFTQRAMTSPEPPEVFTDFWSAVYGANGDGAA